MSEGYPPRLLEELLRPELAEAFRRDPLGPHEGELGQLLDLLRAAPLEGKHVLVRRKGGWSIGRLPEARGEGPRLVDDSVYEDLAEAEWQVFCRRWRALTGEWPDGQEVLRGACEGENDRLCSGKKLMAYADRFSVEPGEPVAFKVSSVDGGSYHADLVELVSGDVDLSGDGSGLRSIASDFEGTYEGRAQPSHAGSYGLVQSLSGWPAAFESATLQCFVCPTLPEGRVQHLMGSWNAEREIGFRLHLDDMARPCMTVRDGKGGGGSVIGTFSLRPDTWWFLAGGFDQATGKVFLVAERISNPRQKEARPLVQNFAFAPLEPGADIAFSFAAAVGLDESVCRAQDHYDGKLESPRLHANALGPRDCAILSGERDAVPEELSVDLLGFWDFSLEQERPRLVDLSGRACHGRLVNLPTRAVRGRLWDGTRHAWKAAPKHYGAIHFHHDDLYDAGWETDFVFTVPTDLKSGVYAARLRSRTEVEIVPFFVVPSQHQPKARCALLMPTASYLAYANEHGAVDIPGNEVMGAYLPGLKPEDVSLAANRQLGYSLYDTHADGSGVVFSSRLRPILNMRPGLPLSWLGPGGMWPWQFAADLDIVAWLYAMGEPFDVVTDEDLHAGGADLLSDYRVVMTGTHPEYHSTEMHDGIRSYLDDGGRLMYLGGNGFYWRVAFSAHYPGAIELRRAEDGVRDWRSVPGEYYHAFTGELGGLWRRVGRPPQSLVGVGFSAQGMDRCTYYRRREESRSPRAAFVFEGIEEEEIGAFGKIGGGAAGLEFDRLDFSLGTPSHALRLATSEDHSRKVYRCPEEVDILVGLESARTAPGAHADMVFFETEAGGAVFSVGSIAWSAALDHNNFDNSVSRITENVLRRFVDPAPFELPEEMQ